jgi:hypothetical protein
LFVFSFACLAFTPVRHVRMRSLHSLCALVSLCFLSILIVDLLVSFSQIHRSLFELLLDLRLVAGHREPNRSQTMARGAIILNTYECNCNHSAERPGPHLRVAFNPQLPFINGVSCQCRNAPSVPTAPEVGCRAAAAAAAAAAAPVVIPSAEPLSSSEKAAFRQSIIVHFDRPLFDLAPTVRSRSTNLSQMLSTPSADEQQLIQRLAVNPKAPLTPLELEQINRLLDRSPQCLTQARIAYLIQQGKYKFEAPRPRNATVIGAAFSSAVLPSSATGRVRNVKNLRLVIPSNVRGESFVRSQSKRIRLFSHRSTDSSLIDTFESYPIESFVAGDQITFSSQLQKLRNKREPFGSCSGESGYETCSPVFTAHSLNQSAIFFHHRPHLQQLSYHLVQQSIEGRKSVRSSSAKRVSFNLTIDFAIEDDPFGDDTPDNLYQTETNQEAVVSKVEQLREWFSDLLFDSMVSIACLLVQSSYEFGVAHRRL